MEVPIEAPIEPTRGLGGVAQVVAVIAVVGLRRGQPRLLSIGEGSFCRTSVSAAVAAVQEATPIGGLESASSFPFREALF